jgi:hypothetical protein
MLKNIKDRWAEFWMKRKRISILIIDGPGRGEVSFQVNNIKAGMNLPPVQGVTIPKIPAGDVYLYNILVNGLVGMGQQIFGLHADHNTKENKPSCTCPVCEIHAGFTKLMNDFAEKKAAENAAATKVVPMSDIVPNGKGLPVDVLERAQGK